ncbi:MAG: hypothetical protein WC292_01885 [Clostridia bacterium]
MDKYYQRNPIGSPPLPRNPVVKTGQWIWILIVSSIPLVNLIAFFYWAFDSTVLPTKKYYARGILSIALISILLAAVAVIVAVFVFSYNFDAILKYFWSFIKAYI